MERLNPDPYGSVGYPTKPCDFPTALRELELMTGADVNVILTETFAGMEIVRCHGQMSLPKSSDRKPGRLLFEIGDDTSFELSKEEFTRAEYAPGNVWAEVGPFVLQIERRHWVDAPDPFMEQFGEA